MTAPEVSQYGAHGNGARTARFSIVTGIEVQVRPTHEEDNTRALLIARELADDVAALAAVRAELMAAEVALDKARQEIGRLAALVPPKDPKRLLGRGFVRFDPSTGAPWVLGKREKGWSSFGYRCDSWGDLFRRFKVRVVEHGTDEHGAWWAVENVGGAS